MFRNESTTVIDKARSREKAKAKTRSENSLVQLTPAPQPAVSSTVVNTSTPKNDSATAKFRSDTARHSIYLKPYISNLPDLSKPIFPTLQERSIGYFATHSSTWIRHFDLVDTICSEAGNTDDHLLASMSAVGLASFSNSVHAPELMIRARRDYGNALQLTNAALRNPAEVKKDSTLFAVMILSIFETVTGNNERSLAAWTEHINGAAALVKLRGEEQFTTQAGQRMFLQVTSNLMLSCIQRTLPMPHHIVVLRKSAEKFMDADNPGWRLSGIIIDLTVLRASIRDRTIVDPKEIIAAALEIDSRFIELFTNLPESWRYQIVYTDETPDLIWNGNYHYYSEFWVANIWNGMRTCRILLHEIIRNQLLYATYAPSPEPIFSIADTISQNAASEEIMCLMRDDILGSVPHHTHTQFAPTKPGQAPSMTHTEGSQSYFVLWPLYLVGAMDLTTIKIREWCIQKLRDIGMTVGLRQAIVVAEYLENGRNIEAWERDGPEGASPEQQWPRRPSELRIFFQDLRAKEIERESVREMYLEQQTEREDDLHDL